MPQEPTPSQISPETRHAYTSHEPKPSQISPETEYAGASREPDPSQILPETEHADALHEPEPPQISPETEHAGASHEPQPPQVSPETEHAGASHEPEPPQISPETEHAGASHEPEPPQISPETEHAGASREPEPPHISPETEHSGASHEPEPPQISPETEHAGASHEPEPSQISSAIDHYDAPEQPSEQGTRKQRVTNTPAQKYVLQKVFASFQYLRKLEIESFAERIGKSNSQIDYWFLNKRRFLFKAQNVSLPGQVSIYSGPIRPEFLACLDEAVAIANRSSFGTLSAKKPSKKGKPQHSNNRHKFDDAQRTLLKILFNKFHYLRHVETKALADRFGKPEEKVREWFYNRRWYDSTYKGLIIEPRPPNYWYKKAMRPEFLSHLNDIPSDQKLMEKEQKTQELKG